MYRANLAGSEVQIANEVFLKEPQGFKSLCEDNDSIVFLRFSFQRASGTEHLHELLILCKTGGSDFAHRALKRREHFSGLIGF